MDQNQFLATMLGGVLAILGGLGGSIVLARSEHRREVQRQNDRHKTAVRIVALELMSNGNAIVRRAPARDISTAGYQSVAIDLFALLPPDLATDVAKAYEISRYAADLDDATDAMLKFMLTLDALREYGKRELGLTFPMTGESNHWVAVPKPNRFVRWLKKVRGRRK